MSNPAIFVVGLFTFLLLAGGLLVTVLEVRHLDGEAQARRQARPAVSQSGIDRH